MIVGWFSKTKESIIPNNLWTKCQKCEEAIYNKDLAKSNHVCPKCGYHFRLSVRDRINLLIDPKTWQELNAHIKTADPLKFHALTSYDERVKLAREIERYMLQEQYLTTYLWYETAVLAYRSYVKDVPVPAQLVYLLSDYATTWLDK